MRTDSVTVTLSEAAFVFKSIEPAEFNRLARGFLRVDPDAITLRQQLSMVLWNWFSTLGILTDAQRQALLTEMAKVLDKYAEDLGSCFDEDGTLQTRSLPIMTVSILDNRYAMWTHTGSQLFDLDENKTLREDDLEQPIGTYFICDVAAWYSRIWRKLQTLRDAHGHGRPNPQPPQAGDAGRKTKPRG